MKQIYLITGLIFLLAHPAAAQNASSMNTTRETGAERRIREIKKIVELSPLQEAKFKAAYEISQRTNDSILYKVSDPVEAANLKYQSDKQLQNTLMQTLTKDQRTQYLTINGTPEVTIKTEAEIQRLRKSGKYSEEELTAKKKEIFDFLMSKKIVYRSDRFNPADRKENLRQLRRTRRPASLQEKDPNKKLAAVKKIIDLSPKEEQALKDLFAADHLMRDSIRTKVSDPELVSKLRRQANERLQSALLSALTEEQQIRYLTVTGVSDVTAKTEARLQLLRGSGRYSEEELTVKKKEIFDYLMAEKIIYLRDKFDIDKRKEDLRLLRKARPSAILESGSLEKVKAAGKMNNGKIKW